MKDLPALRRRRHMKQHLPADERHRHVGAKDELRIGQQGLGVQILAIALEPRIIGDLEDHMDVATLAAARARVPDAAKGHVLIRRDAGRNLYYDFLVAAQSSLTSAFLAGRFDDTSLALARRTGRDRDELPEERSLGATDLSRARTGRAHLTRRARLGAGPSAFVAGVEQLERHGLVDTGGDFLERQRETDFDVGAGANRPAAASGAKEFVEPAEAAAEVAHEDP